MNKLAVLSVFGARPDAIKMGPLCRTLAECADIEHTVCVTAQHREMLDQVLDAFSITPDFDLDIMSRQQTPGEITTRILERLPAVLDKVRPELVLVHGDTTTAFAAALAAFYQKARVGHVEAGLRSRNKLSPYPEEMNRRLAGLMADLHFCPTESNAANLRREGVEDGIFITGNTVIDALRYTVNPAHRFAEERLRDLDFGRTRVVLLTAHRRENYGAPMDGIMRAAARLASENPDVTFVYPVHLSPYVTDTARRHLEGVANIWRIAPLDVFDMHNLMARCHIVLTDSGGLQEEAPSLGKPVLVLRSETERPEAVEAGTVKVVGTDEDAIVRQASALLHDADAYARMANAVNPYGDGDACRRIAQNILYAFGRRRSPADVFGRP